MLRVVGGDITPLIRKGAKLPHLPNGIPEGLAAVAMKALSLMPEDRYATATEMKQDIEAWQNGFATEAEHAGLGTQLKLLIKRNKSIVALASLALLATITALTIGLGIAIQQRNIANNEKQNVKTTLDKLKVAAKQQEAAFHDVEAALPRQLGPVGLSAKQGFMRGAITTEPIWAELHVVKAIGNGVDEPKSQQGRQGRFEYGLEFVDLPQIEKINR